MGTVYAALAPDGQRTAVKVIHPAQAEDPEFRARFRREVQLSARVQGPCLIPLVAADPDADAPWLATAYAPGPTLDRHLAAHGPLTAGTLYAFAAGTAQALAAIHAAGVVHRDVKPQNVILSPAGPRMLDFGIAHAADGTSVTRTGIMTGTPGWISPEHYRTGTTGPEGDMFAWGALVAHAATGRHPFGTGAPDVIAFRIMSQPADLEGIPEGLREIVEKALTKNPSDRISAVPAADACSLLLASEATQVLSDVSRGPETTHLGELGTAQWDIPAPDDPAWPAPRPSSRRRTVTAVLIIAAVVGGVVGGTLAFPTSSASSTGDTTAKAVTSPGSTAQHTGPARPSSGTTQQREDPRTVIVPADPLAGVSRPAYKRTDPLSRSQPIPDDWRASTAARNQGEKDTQEAIQDHMKSVLATKGMDFMKPVITFNRRKQTVMVTGGPVSTLTDDYKEVFRRAGEMGACTILAHRLQDHPTTWPYGRYYIYWKDFDGQTEATPLGYGQATGGCFNEIGGQWRGSEPGMATAGHPSTDRDEIRVAGDSQGHFRGLEHAGRRRSRPRPLRGRRCDQPRLRSRREGRVRVGTGRLQRSFRPCAASPFPGGRLQDCLQEADRRVQQQQELGLHSLVRFRLPGKQRTPRTHSLRYVYPVGRAAVTKARACRQTAAAADESRGQRPSLLQAQPRLIAADASCGQSQSSKAPGALLAPSSTFGSRIGCGADLREARGFVNSWTGEASNLPCGGRRRQCPRSTRSGRPVLCGVPNRSPEPQGMALCTVRDSRRRRRRR
ncbi:serine/threonine-protein kinase [Streptomyces sp. NPDC004609]|uniref:serine/threonine-protein kinase n=1 Tax=Streptomyces sp. NPDC004609 TaxID=3364704 RepID=UPI0036965AAA